MDELRRWLPTIALAVAVCAGCVAAGVWQWHRHVDRSAAVAVVQENYTAAPVPLEDVLAGPDDVLSADDVWRPVRASGRYLETSVLLRNRPVGGQPGFHVLAPFVVEAGPLAGSVLVVDRGWVPTGADSSSAAGVPPPPSGPVDLVVRLRAGEPAAEQDAPAGQVHAIAVEEVRSAAGGAWAEEASLGAYGGLVSEDGARPAGLGRLPQPSTTLGSHLSYAFQWWVFAAGALGGCAVLIRRERREEEQAAELAAGAGDGGFSDRTPAMGDHAGGGTAAAGAGVGSGPGRPRRRRPTAEEEEDALLDAQL